VHRAHQWTTRWGPQSISESHCRRRYGFVPSIVALNSGMVSPKSSHQEATGGGSSVFAGPVAMLPFEEEDAKVAGAVRAALEAEGKPIGAYDLFDCRQVVRRNSG